MDIIQKFVPNWRKNKNEFLFLGIDLPLSGNSSDELSQANFHVFKAITSKINNSYNFASNNDVSCVCAKCIPIIIVNDSDDKKHFKSKSENNYFRKLHNNIQNTHALTQQLNNIIDNELISTVLQNNMDVYLVNIYLSQNIFIRSINSFLNYQSKIFINH